MKKFLTTVLEEIVGDLGVKGVDVQVGFNLENQHGDFTTNVAFIVAKKLHRKPLEMATDIVVLLKRLQTLEKTQVSGEFWRFIKEISVAGSGFINITISGVYFSALLSEVLDQKKGFGTSLKKTGKKLMVEFAHPNTHKAFHIGHLRNITTGESIVRLLEAAGNEVVRVNYQGDVGMHIAKCLYGLQLPIFKSKTSEAEKLSLDEKITLLGKAYAAGSKAFDEDEQAKKEIGELNKQIYEKDQSI